MAQIDLTGIAAFIPVFGFLLVFTVTYALLGKTKALGENKFVHVLVSFALAIIFLVSANAIKFLGIITPWVAALMISLVLIVLVVGIIKGNIDEFFKPAFAWFIVVVLAVIFIASAIYVFSPMLRQYFGQPKQFIMQPQIIGILILGAITVFAAWLLTRGKG